MSSKLTQMLEKKIMEIESVGYYRSPKYSSLLNLREKNTCGVLRVVVLFTGIFIIPCILLIIPLYLKHKTFADVSYAVMESDVIAITDGISSVFCQSQTLKMNTSFSSFQIDRKTVQTTNRKHFRLKKSMSLPDDSLEYWGFFLNKGSTVDLSLCSSHSGGKVMVVKDIKDFHTCGLLEHKRDSNKNPHINMGKNEVHVVNDTNAEVIVPVNEYEGENFSEEMNPVAHSRKTRSANDKFVTHLEGILHGKTDNETDDSSTSSFENTLLTCHDGRMLFTGNFSNSNQCTDIRYLENNTHVHLKVDIHEDGYYFYIFYSDNDVTTNQVYAIFNIFKPTYEYSDYERGCFNQTECTFPITFLSSDKVVAEIPMKNGIDHEVDELQILVSTCQPRTLVYLVFPVAVLILILGFSFV